MTFLEQKDMTQRYHLTPWQRVSTVLLASMVIVTGLMVTMGAMAYFQIQATQSIVKEAMVRSDGRYLSTRIRVEGLYLSDLMSQYVVHDTTDDRARLRVIFEESSRRMQELFRQAFNIFDGSEKNIVWRANAQVETFLKEAIMLMDTHDEEGGFGERTRDVFNRMVILREPMLDAIRSLEDLETDNLDKARRQARLVSERSLWMIISVGGVILALTLFVMFLNIQRMFFPLIDIQRAVESVASGKLDHPIQATRQDEFGVLAQAFNHMMAQMRTLIGSLEQRVAHRTEELSDSNKKLKEEILERRRAEEDLLKAFNELKNIQRQLIQSEKMAMVGQLAAGVVHEINNPVAFLINNMAMLKEYFQAVACVIDKYRELEKTSLEGKNVPESMLNALAEHKKEVNFDFILKDMAKLFEEMDEGLERVKKIVVDLKVFSHAGNEQKEMADINKLMDSALNIAGNELKYKVNVIKRYSNLTPVFCYPQQLSQVFINLLVNASQAIKDKGTITVRTFADGNDAVVDVEDNGEGIDDGAMAHLFEPFFTTKSPGMGTGLGLSISYNIIQKHKGSISVKSILGKGSVFTIRIPFKQEA